MTSIFFPIKVSCRLLTTHCFPLQRLRWFFFAITVIWSPLSDRMLACCIEWRKCYLDCVLLTGCLSDRHEVRASSSCDVALLCISLCNLLQGSTLRSTQSFSSTTDTVLFAQSFALKCAGACQKNRDTCTVARKRNETFCPPVVPHREACFHGEGFLGAQPASSIST